MLSAQEARESANQVKESAIERIITDKVLKGRFTAEVSKNTMTESKTEELRNHGYSVKEEEYKWTISW